MVAEGGPEDPVEGLRVGRIEDGHGDAVAHLAADEPQPAVAPDQVRRLHRLSPRPQRQKVLERDPDDIVAPLDGIGRYARHRGAEEPRQVDSGGDRQPDPLPGPRVEVEQLEAHAVARVAQELNFGDALTAQPLQDGDGVRLQLRLRRAACQASRALAERGNLQPLPDNGPVVPAGGRGDLPRIEPGIEERIIDRRHASPAVRCALLGDLP